MLRRYVLRPVALFDNAAHSPSKAHDGPVDHGILLFRKPHGWVRNPVKVAIASGTMLA
jgi:hypothetical protein